MLSVRQCGSSLRQCWVPLCQDPKKCKQLCASAKQQVVITKAALQGWGVNVLDTLCLTLTSVCNVHGLHSIFLMRQASCARSGPCLITQLFDFQPTLAPSQQLHRPLQLSAHQLCSG